MGSIFKLLLCLYILSLIFSMVCGLFRALVDIAKWHDREKKVLIKSSASEFIEKVGDIDEREHNSDDRDRAGDSDDLDGDNFGGDSDSESGNEPLVF